VVYALVNRLPTFGYESVKIKLTLFIKSVNVENGDGN
jgi:hypothetical protein